MRRAIQFVVAAALLATTACSGVNIDTVWDTQFDFVGLSTYDWAPKEPETGADLNYGSIETAVKAAVDRQMTAAGFRLSSDNPSFLITYYVGVEEVTRITENYFGRGWGGYWGWGWFGPAGLNVSQYDVGTITIDLLSPDPAIGMVWRGIARAELLPSSQDSGKIDSAIAKIFEDFPPTEER